jgi:DNA-binding XRE family transcriptional regulator
MLEDRPSSVIRQEDHYQRYGGVTMEHGMKPRELKEIRERMGFTQEQLATELGVHRLSVLRWEAGAHRIPLMLTLAIKQLETRLLQTQFSQTVPR